VPPEVVSQFEQHKRIQDQAGLGPGGAMLPVGPAPRPPPPAGPMPPPRPQQSMTPPRQQGSLLITFIVYLSAVVFAYLASLA